MSTLEFMLYDEIEWFFKKTQQVLDEALQFWTAHSHDEEFGGFFNCLDRTGQQYDTTKYGHLQAQQIWSYCHLYLSLERFRKPEVLEAAVKASQFLMDKFKDPKNGNFYHSTSREGKPKELGRDDSNMDCYYTMAMIGLCKATGQKFYKEEALKTFAKVRERLVQDGSSRSDQAFPSLLPGHVGKQTLESLCFLLLLVQEFDDLSGEHKVCEKEVDLEAVRSWVVRKAAHHVTEGNLEILENVTRDGKFLPSDTCEGRLIVPGHIARLGRLLLKEAVRTKSANIKELAVEKFIKKALLLNDEENGGYFTYLDKVDNDWIPNGNWSDKLWWVQLEYMGCTMLYFTECILCEKAWTKFKDLAQYCLRNFMDEKYGEWFGFLRVDGKQLTPVKGSPEKGFFHLPLILADCENMMAHYLRRKVYY